MTPMMPLSFQFLSDRAESLRRAAETIRPPSRDRLDDLRDLVRYCLTLPADCRDLTTSVRRRLFDTLREASGSSRSLEAAELLAGRERTTRLLDSFADTIRLALNLVRHADVAGRLDEFVPRLETAAADVISTRDAFSENYPFRTPAEVAEARTATGSGAALELDDAFAEIAGVSKEEWRAKVEARRRQTRP